MLSFSGVLRGNFKFLSLNRSIPVAFVINISYLATQSEVAFARARHLAVSINQTRQPIPDANPHKNANWSQLIACQRGPGWNKNSPHMSIFIRDNPQPWQQTKLSMPIIIYEEGKIRTTRKPKRRQLILYFFFCIKNVSPATAKVLFWFFSLLLHLI